MFMMRSIGEFMSSPGFLSVRSSVGSDLSYLLAVTFTTLFLISGALAVKRYGLAHHRMMLISMAVMLGYFAFYYQVRRLGLASMADQLEFAGPEWVYHKVFRPILYAHFLAVTLSLFLAVYMVANGFRTAVIGRGAIVLKNERIAHSKALWLLGLVWLVFLAWWVFSRPRFDWGHRAMFLSLGYFIPASSMFLTGRALPYSERRHRVMGRLCLGMFVLLLVTSTSVYYLLYIVY